MDFNESLKAAIKRTEMVHRVQKVLVETIAEAQKISDRLNTLKGVGYHYLKSDLPIPQSDLDQIEGLNNLYSEKLNSISEVCLTYPELIPAIN